MAYAKIYKEDCGYDEIRRVVWISGWSNNTIPSKQNSPFSFCSVIWLTCLDFTHWMEIVPFDTLRLWTEISINCVPQIENEYGPMEYEIGAPGRAYTEWAAKMAVGLGTGVPWVMCKQDDAPDPIVSATKPNVSIHFCLHSRFSPFPSMFQRQCWWPSCYVSSSIVGLLPNSVLSPCAVMDCMNFYLTCTWVAFALSVSHLFFFVLI